nr:acetyltransferase [Bacteriovorax sp. HI3]
MKKEVIIFGTGGHSKVVYDIIVKEGVYTPVAFVSLNQNLKTFLDLPHYHQNEFSKLKFEAGVVAIGDNWVRSKIVETVISINKNFNFIKAIHPSAQIGTGCIIGKGTVVMANTVINPFSTVGEHSIINTSSSIDHDCTVGNFASIAPGATLGGTVSIGDFSTISLGANVIHGRTVGPHTVVGAGSLVIKDIEDHAFAYGLPCKVIRKRAEDEKYL